MTNRTIALLCLLAGCSSEQTQDHRGGQTAAQTADAEAVLSPQTTDAAVATVPVAVEAKTRSLQTVSLATSLATATATEANTATATATATSTGTATTARCLPVWNGDDVAGGAGWAVPSSNAVTVQAQVAKAGMALAWDVPAQANPWSEWGWNWKAWQQPGTDIVRAKALCFSLKLTGPTPPADIVVTIRSALNAKYAHQPPADGGLRGVSLHLYEADFADGSWHDVVIPVADLISGEDDANFTNVYEIYMGAAGSGYDLYLDNIGFE